MNFMHFFTDVMFSFFLQHTMTTPEDLKARLTTPQSAQALKKVEEGMKVLESKACPDVTWGGILALDTKPFGISEAGALFALLMATSPCDKSVDRSELRSQLFHTVARSAPDDFPERLIKAQTTLEEEKLIERAVRFQNREIRSSLGQGLTPRMTLWYLTFHQWDRFFAALTAGSAVG